MKASKSFKEIVSLKEKEEKRFQRKERKRLRNQLKNRSHIREKLFKEQFGCCAYCRRILLLKEITIDHLKPLSKGGTNDLDNLRGACRQCNSRKGNLPASFLYE
jgi:uncharacterized protein (TIGR02646 family)